MGNGDNGKTHKLDARQRSADQAARVADDGLKFFTIGHSRETLEKGKCYE
jgi:hypothetical protein